MLQEKDNRVLLILAELVGSINCETFGRLVARKTIVTRMLGEILTVKSRFVIFIRMIIAFLNRIVGILRVVYESPIFTLVDIVSCLFYLSNASRNKVYAVYLLQGTRSFCAIKSTAQT